MKTYSINVKDKNLIFAKPAAKYFKFFLISTFNIILLNMRLFNSFKKTNIWNAESCSNSNSLFTFFPPKINSHEAVQCIWRAILGYPLRLDTPSDTTFHLQEVCRDFHLKIQSSRTSTNLVDRLSECPASTCVILQLTLQEGNSLT